jgi:prepilin-type N-terminal cleavage/methylation domain-containing protein
MLTFKTRKAFTMIELIFVILITSILAAIAIPKLAATGMDAKLSTKAQNIMIAANEIASYAVSNGHTEANLTDMSNSIKSMISRDEAVDTGSYQVDVKVEESNNCIIIKIDNPGIGTETLIIDYGGDTNSYCDQLRSLIDNEAFPIPLHGTLISY